MRTPVRDVPILFESNEFLVVNKPPGILTIPGRDPGAESLLNILSQKQKLWVVHRLDRETSGCLIFAKNESSHREACKWFENHETKKEYVTFATGEPRVPVQKFDAPVEGARALSQMSVSGRFSGGFIAVVRIVTGRRHQIRIHLSGGGYPIFGDPTYGGRRDLDTGEGLVVFSRVALHAKKLELPNGLKFEAPYPDDFQNWSQQLGVKLP